VNPHLGHRYDLPKLRHFEQRQMVISPQLGHRNLVASNLGVIILLHEVHVGMIAVALSLNIYTSDEIA